MFHLWPAVFVVLLFSPKRYWALALRKGREGEKLTEMKLKMKKCYTVSSHLISCFMGHSAARLNDSTCTPLSPPFLGCSLLLLLFCHLEVTFLRPIFMSIVCCFAGSWWCRYHTRPWCMADRLTQPASQAHTNHCWLLLLLLFFRMLECSALWEYFICLILYEGPVSSICHGLSLSLFFLSLASFLLWSNLL